MSTDLVTFLRARLDEDEATLRQPPGPHSDYHGSDPYGAFSPSCPACLDGWPGRGRALAEVEAKRQIVELHRAGVTSVGTLPSGPYSSQRCTTCEPQRDVPGSWWPCATIRAVALAYRDHPDYDPAWEA